MVVRRNWGKTTMAKPLNGKYRSTINYFKQYWTLYLLLAVPIAYFVIFRYIPMTYIQVAFKRYSIVQNVWEMPWARNKGLEYFIRAFSNRDFLFALRNTITLNFLDLLVGFPASILRHRRKIAMMSYGCKQFIPYSPLLPILVMSFSCLSSSERSSIQMWSTVLNWIRFEVHSELLFHVLSTRNERGSVIITTNLEFSRWTEIFPDAMLNAFVTRLNPIKVVKDSYSCGQ